MAFGGPRGFQPTPPEKGSFPLDHHAECRQPMQGFLECLKRTDSQHHKCKDLSKRYLKCRMNKGLMVEEDLEELGFRHKIEIDEELLKKARDNQKERKGFFGGVSVTGTDKK